MTRISSIKINEQILLADFTTFKLGGICRGLIHCETPEDLETAIKYLATDHLPFILIGSGSNLVISDEAIDCYVVRYVSSRPLIEKLNNEVIVSGSTLLNDLARFTSQEGLEGLTFASGIPGTVGGAVVGNAGAFGKQVGDVLKSAILLTRRGIQKEVTAKDFQFTYRHSTLKETGDLIVSLRFCLWPGNREKLFKEREEILNIRREKHPDLQKYPCAGSFFRNIEPTSKAEKRQAAGFFLEEACGKNLHVGGARVFDKHANIIIKGKKCRAQDVYELHKKMYKLVKDKFGLELVREVRFVGKFVGMPEDVKEIIW